jgi:hypothetical protein
MTMIYKTLHRNQQTEKHEQENDNDLQNTTQKSTDWETRTGKWQWSTKHYTEISESLSNITYCIVLTCHIIE